MYDSYRTYTGAFLIAGLPPMIFGVLLTTTKCVRKTTTEKEDADPKEPKLLSPLTESGNKEGKGSSSSTVIPTAEHLLLLSDTVYPNYTS